MTGAEESEPAPFVVGIDLGTTNSAAGFIDSRLDRWSIQTFAIPQLVAPGQVERRETLPSFHYEPAHGELPDHALTLPWQATDPGSATRFGVGVFARDFGRSVPGRLIESAKSWLCHNGVDRRSALLPWHGAADAEAISPVEASARYLRHLRAAWDVEHPDAPLAAQDVVLTIPASFDEVARELTVAAAKSAGLPKIVLIEEPQAAFYSWVDSHRDDWEQHVESGQRILICDIGGGTSDFTLIHVRSGDGGRLQFQRVAVGDHLILGGDNLDLALAHHIERKLRGDGGRLEPRQWSVLVSTCRQVKELLLSDAAPERTTVSLPGSGARLIGGALQVVVTRDEVVELLVEGFLPRVGFDEVPQRRQSGFQEFGLPYAADPAITRYLAAFLKTHQQQSDRSSDAAGDWPGGTGTPLEHAARPDIVLFNGGFFDSPVLRERLLSVLCSWFTPVGSNSSHSSNHNKPGDHEAAGKPQGSNESEWRPQVLRNDRLDLAVARGAAYFGMVRRGIGVRIAAGLARTFYVGVESDTGAPSALCLIAAGTEPSDRAEPIARDFAVRTSEPVEFPIFVSSTRLTDRPGETVPIDSEQMTSLPPIRTILRTKKSAAEAVIPARLSARLTEIGTLEMWCQQIDTPRRWQLQFDIRSSVETDREAHTGEAERSGIVAQELIDAALALILDVFGPAAASPPDGLPKRVAAALEQSRNEWPTSLLRSQWQILMDGLGGRAVSESHEARWLNMLGFALRPGFGMAADDWRVEETWKQLRGRPLHSGAMCEAEWWILWRRIAAGLSEGRQIELTSSVLPRIRREHRHLMSGLGKGATYAASNHAAAEVWRMLGSMELIPQATRRELGGLILDLLPKNSFKALSEPLIWALGRIGSRVPVHGPLNAVLPPDAVLDWLPRLIRLADVANPVTHLALMQLCRKTGDRFRDLPDSTRRDIALRLSDHDARPHFVDLVREGGSLDTEEERLVFGESLPAGLRIMNE